VNRNYRGTEGEQKQKTYTNTQRRKGKREVTREETKPDEKRASPV
jgi:hypothetical protein